MIRFAVLALAACVAAADAHAQCRTADRAVAKKMSIGAAPSATSVSNPIRVCERHEYKLVLKAGQRVEVKLTSPSGQKGMLTLVAPSGEKPADGQNEWSGAVAESGSYTIEIGTDQNTRYTLSIVLR